MSKKIISTILCIVLILSCFSVFASAATVEMGNNNKTVASDYVYGYYKLVSASNKSNSSGDVTATAQRKLGILLYNDVSYILKPGKKITNKQTSYRSSEVYWRLKLTSNGGCYASGSIIY